MVGGGVQKQMVSSHTVVTAEGAARLNLAPVKGTGIEDESAPVSRVYDGDFLVGTAHGRRSLCRYGHFGHNGLHRPDIQIGVSDTLGHKHLSCRTDIVEIVH